MAGWGIFLDEKWYLDHPIQFILGAIFWNKVKLGVNWTGDQRSATAMKRLLMKLLTAQYEEINVT
jgi:hypothetical protein